MYLHKSVKCNKLPVANYLFAVQNPKLFMILSNRPVLPLKNITGTHTVESKASSGCSD